MSLGRMDLARCDDCCGAEPLPCCGEVAPPTTMVLTMANWSSAHRPGVPYIGNPFTSEDEVTIDLTPFNGTHVLVKTYPIANYNVSGTIFNGSGCAWGKVFTIPVTWINRVTLVSRTDNIVVLAELLDSASRLSSLHFRVLYPNIYDVLGTWYETRWAHDAIYFEVQGLPNTSYVYPNFLLGFAISQIVSTTSKCSEYDLEYPTYLITLSSNLTLATQPTFAVLAP